MNLLKVAASQLGVQEIEGIEDNPQVVAYAKETGITGIETDEIPWCSTFINWCAKQANLPMSHKPNARSWVNIGKLIHLPKAGDVVVFWRESPTSWKGHVAIFLGFNKSGKKVICLGGNQKNAVSIMEYDAEKVLTYRRLEEIETFNVPNPVLKKGSKGQSVIQLQILLNHLKCNCGDADGDFGKKTENALKLFQANNLLTINGIYQDEEKNCIESLLQS